MSPVSQQNLLLSRLQASTLDRSYSNTTFKTMFSRVAISVFILPAALGCDAEAPRVNPSATAVLTKLPAAVQDLDGLPLDPLRENADLVRTFVFSRTDCPIARRYAPEIRRLCERFSSDEVIFYLVFPNPDRTGEEIRQHLDEFELPCAGLRDPEHVLVSATGVQITPEAAVFDATGKLVYVGRIDDRFPKFGVAREPTTHELEDAILAALGKGTMPVAPEPAVGCYISDLKP